VSRDARRVIEVAKEHGALGWKVNGAGGDGGSLTILTGTLSHVKRAMIENTEAQERLHSDLVSRDARRVIEVAKEHGALGWKVNGAGGDGGSLTILTGTLSHVKRAMIREIETENPMFKNIPIYLSRYGLRTWDRQADSSGQ
jgi:D-glycero-alpha-D-manno-heptose-7-phosphate kinase